MINNIFKDVPIVNYKVPTPKNKRSSCTLFSSCKCPLYEGKCNSCISHNNYEYKGDNV